MEERTTGPRSSVSWTGSSLHEYQSTTRKRFSFTAPSTSTPKARSCAKAASADSDEIATRPLPPAFRPSARKVKAKRSFSWPGGPWRTTLEPIGSPPWTIASNPSMPVRSRSIGSHPRSAVQVDAEQRDAEAHPSRSGGSTLEGQRRAVLKAGRWFSELENRDAAPARPGWFGLSEPSRVHEGGPRRGSGYSSPIQSVREFF